VHPTPPGLTRGQLNIQLDSTGLNLDANGKQLESKLVQRQRLILGSKGLGPLNGGSAPKLPINPIVRDDRALARKPSEVLPVPLGNGNRSQDALYDLSSTTSANRNNTMGQDMGG
jgi:hypothetical protein